MRGILFFLKFYVKPSGKSLEESVYVWFDALLSVLSKGENRRSISHSYLFEKHPQPSISEMEVILRQMSLIFKI
jgi:hypothetical protein